MGTTLYTIGHSNQALAQFITSLTNRAVTTLVDIRAYPQSKRYPYFSMGELREHVQLAGITYHWAGRQLGGMRKPSSHSQHTALHDDGFRAFADHMETPAFQQATVQLIHLARQSTTVMMCAERLPENCHRSLISDYLTLQGVDVIHILDGKESRQHQLSPFARRESSRLIYDRHTTGHLL